ncbi:MAG: InlB B-repeat-containing protein [Clostridia bacterium]|nr:InlB B-repeat-containing protein [Clostridia bacterium]
MDKLHGTWKNRILCVAVLVFVFIMAAQAMHNGMFTALALEQPARCGVEEHVHTEECYIDHVLICEKKAHTHSENCYLLLLEDNDINWLLSAVDSTVDNNLNSVIESAVFQALTSDSTDEEIATNFAETLQTSLTIGTAAAYTTAYTTALTTTGFFFTDVVETTAYETTAPVATLYALENTTIPTLNTTITENNIQPAVVLNENLVSTMAVDDTADSDVSVAAVGGTASTGTRAINFYIRLDGNITFINSGTLNYNNSKQTQNRREYYSYTNAVNAYTEVVVTDLTTNNINSTYYFRYNTSGSTSNSNNFDSRARYESSRVYFADSNNAQYAILSTTSYSTTPVDFYTVTLDLSAVGEEYSVQYVQDGLSPELSDEYHWYTDAAGTNQIETSTYTVADTTTLYAKPKGYTVTFDSNGGSAVASQTVSRDGTATATKPADPTREGYTFAGWYSDAGLTTEYGFASAVTSNITLYAKWTPKTYTFTYIYTNKTETSDVTYGTTVTLPDPGTGYVWVSGSTAYQGGDTVTVTGNRTFTASASVYATYIDADGNTTTSDAVTPGTGITLPAVSESGNVWVDEDGKTYQGGATVTLTENMTFTEKATLTVNYTVNFPTSFSPSITPQETTPTLVGGNNVVVSDGATTVVNNVSDQNVEAVYTTTTSRYATVHFFGWTTEDGTLISAGTTLTWDVLSAYDDDGDGTVELTGSWDYGYTSSVNFFIRYNTEERGPESNLYTPVIFSTWAGNATDTTFKVEAPAEDAQGNDAPDSEYYAKDRIVRAMYGEKASGMWFAEFPDDEDMFTALKTYADQALLLVDGKTVKADELTGERYTIRWYQVASASEGSFSTWHVDGRLVEKKGQITVDKEFYGDATAIAKAESGFYISAVNGTQDEDGNFTAYTSTDADFKQYVLVLDEEAQEDLEEDYPNATFILYDEDASSTDAHNYEWLIEGVTLGEYWQIEEHLTSDVDDYAWYAEYSIYDTDGVVTAIAEYGTTASVVGKTFALDEDPDQGLFVDFRNYYYPDDSILIKKEDGETGQPIGGATFELWQYNSDGELVQLKFSVDDGNYEMDSDGSITQISTGAEGHTTIEIEDFSYEYGDVLVKEVGAPAGYDAAPNITLKATEAGVQISDVRYDGAETELDNSDHHYAEVYDNGSVLIVKDYSSKSTSVTVSKVWDGDTTADSVKIVLQVNGSHANAVFPSLKNVEVELSADNNWTYTWEDLPAYANGAPAEWSVKETVIGSEVTTSDGVTFANWIVAYSAATKTDADGDGITDNWSYTVTNTVRRTLLYLNKVDSSGAALTGAAFTLELVNVKNGAFEGTGTFITALATDSVGQFKFDNLTAGAYYRLTETTAPRGYFGMDDSVVIKVDSAGLVQLAEIVDGSVQTSTLSGAYVNYTVPYNIAFTNRAAQPLPETGGGGTFLYTCGGLLLLAAAASLLLYKALRRREEFPDV